MPPEASQNVLAEDDMEVSESSPPVSACSRPSVVEGQIAQKSRRRSGTPHKPETLAADDPIILIINLAISWGHGIDYLRSLHLEATILRLKPEFVFPDKTVNFGLLLNKAKTLYLNKLMDEGFYNFCYIYIEDCDQTLSVFSFAVTKKYRKVYLCQTLINVVDEATSKTDLEQFCDESVKHFSEKFGRDAKYLLYDGNITLEERASKTWDPNKQVYFRIHCISNVIRKLRYDHPPFVVHPNTYKEDQEQMEPYRIYMENLEMEFKMSEYSLGEGVEKILQVLDQWPTVVNVDLKKFGKALLSPASLGANMMHPKYKGQRFQQLDTSLYAKMEEEFLDYALPTSFDSYFYYRQNSTYFMSHVDHEHNPLRYWSIVSRKYSELADFGVEMYSIPAIMSQVNKTRLRIVSAKWTPDSSYLRYAMSLIANDRI